MAVQIDYAQQMQELLEEKSILYEENTHLREILARRDEELAQCEMKLEMVTERRHWEAQITALPQPTLAVSRKVTVKAISRYLEKKEPDEDGWYQVEPWRIGKFHAGQSDQTVRDNIAHISDEYYPETSILKKKAILPLFDKKVVPFPDGSGKESTYIRPLELLYSPRNYTSNVAKEIIQGGARLKCVCGSERFQKRVILTCMECGTVKSDQSTPKREDLSTTTPKSQVDFCPPEQLAESINQNELPLKVNLPESLSIEGVSQVDFCPPAEETVIESTLVEPATDVSTVGVSTEHLEHPPTELRALPIWCCHRAKVPYTPRGRSPQKAKVNDASSWGTYEQARKMYEDSNEHGWKEPFDGIGLMCDGTFTLADYDHCLEHGQIAVDRWDQIERINTYKEVSYSGTGIHSLSWGTIPAARKLPEIEMYCGGKDKGRFITWTGNHIIGTPTTIEHQQEQITTLYNEITPQKEILPTSAKIEIARPGIDYSSATDEEIIRKAKNAGNGAKFTRLFAGDITGYATTSEADLALCNMLAYWTNGTVDTIRRLFCMSGLYREKWERADYSSETIEKAVDSWRLRQHQKSA